MLEDLAAQVLERASRSFDAVLCVAPPVLAVSDAAILGRDFAGQMEAAFAADLAESQAVDLERWEARSIALRLQEWASRLWEYWL